MGTLSSDYPAEIGHRIPILVQIFINGSFKLFGIHNFHITSGPMFTENLLAPHDTTGLGDGGTPNHNWPVSCPRNVSVLWRGAVPARPPYMHRSLENARAAARRVCDDWLHGRHHLRKRSPSKSRNPVQNPRIICRDDDREGPVDRYLLLQISVASVSKVSFLSITSVSR